jgi:hypothetical protein
LLCLLITLLVIVLSVLPPVMSSEYHIGDNAVRLSPLLCLLISLLAIVLSVFPLVMSSDYPFGDNALRPSPCYEF